MENCEKLGGVRSGIMERRRILCSDCVQRPVCLPAVLDDQALSRFEVTIEQPGPMHAGQVLARAGTPARAIYALQCGAIKTLNRDVRGLEQVVAFHVPGTVLGLTDEPNAVWSCTHVALEETWVCRIPRQVLDKTLQRRLAELTRANLQREYEFQLKLADRSATQRLASFLLKLLQIYKKPGKTSPRNFRLPMSRLDMASYLGLTQAALRQGFSELDVGGWVKAQGRNVEIRDPAGLQRLDS